MNREDYYWLNEDSRTFASRGYLLESESAEQRFRGIAEVAEKILGITGFADKFEKYIKRGYYSLSSPVISNFGRDRGLPISCFGSMVSDNMESILEKVAEVGMMTKGGGGTSGYFGDIRGRGTPISSGGTSTGSVHFMELFDKLMNVVSQGNVRRGSFAAYLPVEHPDINEFLKIRDEGSNIQDLSIGVTISDEWMRSMLGGDSEKRKVWAAIIKKRFESGYPYLMFADNANNQAPQVYKDKGLKIHNSNLCVTGDQRVVTNLGLLKAEDLYKNGSELQVFDNQNIVSSSKMHLIEKNADVYKVTLANGMSHTITKEHKICAFDSSTSSKGKYKVKTQDKTINQLKIGDKIAIQTNKGLFGSRHMPKEAFLLGIYQADGTQHEDRIMFDVWENDFDLLEEIQSNHDYICEKYETQTTNNTKHKNATFIDCVVCTGTVKKKRLSSNALKKALNFEKGYIPNWIWESDEKTIWQYIRGLYYADGTVNVNGSEGNPTYLSITNINKDFLCELQLLLSNLGLQSSLHIQRLAGIDSLPNGRGGYSLYKTKDAWRLIIGNKNDALEFEKHTGFLSRKGIYLENRVYRDNTKKFSKIKSIEYAGKEDVYCLTVNSDNHHWICNGVITHNCNEIYLSNSPDESFVCCLGSMNLDQYDEWKDTDAVKTYIYFLDAVISEFITKTDGVKFMEAPRKFAINQRALGLGVLGWHSLLQQRMIPFESMQAKYLNVEIFKLIREQADQATEELAKLLGEPPLLQGYGRRNSTTLSVAPTTSSSFLLGQVSPSIEPLESCYFVKDLAKGRFTYKNPYLMDLLEKKGKNDDETWLSILKAGGSVLHLDFLTEDEKDVFKTFRETNQKEIVIQNIQRQKYVDQGISLNLMIPHDTKAKDVSDLLIFGWENGLKGFYYQRSTNPSKELARSIMKCKSCEA